MGDLIPDLLPPRVSEYRARRESEERGEAVTHKQFTVYLEVGLIPPRGEDGLWPREIVDALVAIKRLGPEVRPLPRRVLRLRADESLFRIPGDKLQAAMCALLPTVSHPMRNLRLVARAGTSPGATTLRRRLPSVCDWDDLIRAADPGLLEAWARGWYAMAIEMVPAFYAPKANPLAHIPLEEQVVLYAVLDLSRREAERVR